MMGAFPRPSETFIVNQMAGVIEAGHDVHIYASSRVASEAVDSTVQRYDLMARMRHLEIPRNHARRASTALGYVAKCGLWRRPRLLRHVLDVREHGQHARNLSLLYTAISFAGNPGYDIVHCQFGDVGARAVALKRGGMIDGRLVVSFRGADLSRLVKNRPTAYDALFAEADLFLPVSEQFRQRLISMGCPPERIQVLYSGINPQRFKAKPRRVESGKQVRLLSIGRLTPKKGFVYGIEAVARLLKAGYDVRYTILGEGELRTELSRRIETHGIETKVDMPGWKGATEVEEYLDWAHLLLAPCVTADDGDEEGIPNVIKEAMASGMPVVSSIHGGIPELVEHGVSGLLAPEKEIEALTSCLAQLLDNPQCWPAMGAAGRKRVEDRFDSVRLTDRLIHLYERLLQP